MELLLVRLLLVLVGLLPAGVVLLKTRANRRLIATGIKTKGVVQQVLGSSHGGLNAIDIAYTTRAGARVLKRLTVAGLPYRVGQELPLVYDPDDPQRLMLGWKNHYAFVFAVTGAIALAFLAFAVRLDEL